MVIPLLLRARAGEVPRRRGSGPRLRSAKLRTHRWLRSPEQGRRIHTAHPSGGPPAPFGAGRAFGVDTPPLRGRTGSRRCRARKRGTGAPSLVFRSMVKAYKYMSGIFVVTHSSKQQDTDCARQPNKMDINRLQEQYHCFKEKQKLQTHVIVFKAVFTGGNEAVPTESMVSTVLINKGMRRALKEREIKLDLPCSGNAQVSSPWRMHLGVHRLAHHQKRPCDIVPNQNEHSMLSCQALLESTEQALASSSKEENLHPTEETVHSNSPRTSVTSIWTYSSLNTSASKPAPSKLPYYPFPQKKNPKISEAARKLGLYVSQ
ncbi:uncharacterized protein LOC134496140 [Candoia aspera]|uniref:uncharacterized protein LOC134496140 n=1 Tax=Candoia aspera TaxID=51853 RepID=UPI002FD80933